ncbi:hypothetical protein L1987_30926 [Smallanthus sonchifolius]|uniref:Uncharacterized protein n=1 Tax=Smallanthus sonchifolius TaxID=185202 RepID=A0ACB9I520_9ASTR|nr:hypothetical protein L1987_30926 [Smallanthus sonchifolius]
MVYKSCKMLFTRPCLLLIYRSQNNQILKRMLSKRVVDTSLQQPTYNPSTTLLLHRCVAIKHHSLPL